MRRAIVALMFVVANLGTPAAADQDVDRLQETIGRYERIVDQGGWPTVVAGPTGDMNVDVRGRRPLGLLDQLIYSHSTQ